jgi:hypothetical protein
MSTLGASPGRGCRLPDAILHGKRSHRPHSRAAQRLAAAELLSEAFQLAWAGGCATGLRTRPRHVCDFLCASWPLSFGSAAAFGSALARSHGSRLLTLRLLFAHRPAVSFVTSPAFWKVFTDLAWTPCPPRFKHSFCPSFDGFLSAGCLSAAARATCSVLDAAATGYPLGNCDSLNRETRLSYLIRLGTVSHRSSPPSSLFALLTARERRQRNW